MQRSVGLSRLRVRVLVRMIVVVGGGIWRMRLPTDVELRCANAPANHRLRPDRIRRNREAAERLPHVLELHAGIDQCAEDHVAGGTREAVEIERGQDPQSYQQRRDRPSAPLGDRADLEQRAVPLVAQDDVIHDVDPHDHAGAEHPAGQNQVVVARRRIA